LHLLIADKNPMGLSADSLVIDRVDDIAPGDPPPLLAQDIARLLAEQDGWRNAAAAPIKVTGPLGASGFSRIFRGDGAMFPSSVAIKQFLLDPTGASPAESARTYFLGLQKIAGIAAALGQPAIKPYALLESQGIVVASWIEGPTLARSMAWASAERRRELIREPGLWLARLHRAGGIERRPPDIAGMLAHLKAVIAENSRQSGPLTRRALSVLRSTGSLLAMQPVPWSHHYGDFKPDNLILREGRLVAIDVELSIATPTVNDAADFLNHLQLACYLPHAVPRWREASRLIGLFCQGYTDAGGEPLPPRLLLWQRLYNAMYLMIHHGAWCSSPMAWPSQLALRHLVRSLCDTVAG
jgi:tRNA A-37 threonylcarbamoyl transferase component Bud32